MHFVQKPRQFEICTALLILHHQKRSFHSVTMRGFVPNGTSTHHPKHYGDAVRLACAMIRFEAITCEWHEMKSMTIKTSINRHIEVKNNVSYQSVVVDEEMVSVR